MGVMTLKGQLGHSNIISILNDYYDLSDSEEVLNNAQKAFTVNLEAVIQ